MAKEILYTTAVDRNEDLIHIDNAEKGKRYYCPLCKEEFILRKSGKTGKGSRRPHFAHKELSPNCTPERVLHNSFKTMLINLLEKYRAENKQLIMNWECGFCNFKNSGNLLEKVKSIKEECTLEACRPDIALLNDEESVFAVIEIVVTHKPEENVLQYYKENKIVLIQINLSSDEDLKIFEDKIAKPDIVDYCLNPRSLHYDQYEVKRIIHFYLDLCGRCFHRIIKYYIEIDSVFGKQKSFDFTQNEIDIVKLKHKNVEMRINKTTKNRYPVYICQNCKRIRNRYRRRPRL